VTAAAVLLEKDPRLNVFELDRSRKELMPQNQERGRVVLVVDPSADTRLMYVQFLRLASGVLVASADSAEDAIRFCHEIRPDGIVADLGLGSQDDAGFFDTIRSIVGPDTCVVAITGAPNPPPHPAISTILRKPLDPKRLLDSVGVEWRDDD